MNSTFVLYSILVSNCQQGVYNCTFEFYFIFFVLYVYVAASNPDVADMLPHLRGQGVMDLEYESDGR